MSMSRECLSPNLCNLAWRWIVNFNKFIWLYKLDITILYAIARKMGFTPIGRDLVDDIALQRSGDNAIITLPLRAREDLKYIEPMLDDMLEVEIDYVSVIMRIYMNKQITFKIGDYDVRVWLIDIDTCCGESGLMGVDSEMIGGDSHSQVASVRLVYKLRCNGKIDEDRFIEPQDVSYSMLPHVIEDRFDNMHEEFKEALNHAYDVVRSIADYASKTLKDLALKYIGFDMYIDTNDIIDV